MFSCSLQRSKFAGELQNELINLGEPAPSEHSTVAAALHRGWINIKSVVTNRDNHAILAECERGEDSAVAEYRKALKAAFPAPLEEIVNRQFQEVLATHNSVRGLRDQLAAQKATDTFRQGSGRAICKVRCRRKAAPWCFRLGDLAGRAL